MEQANNFISFYTDIAYRRILSKKFNTFEKKWIEFEAVSNIVDELFKLYVDGNNKNWYNAYDVFAPSTNNCLEKFNGTMKSRCANFNKYDIVSFLRICLEAIINFEEITPILQRQIYNKPEIICPNDGVIFRFKEITKVNETILYFCIKQEYQEFNYDHLLKIETLTKMKSFFKENNIFYTHSLIENWKDMWCSCYIFMKRKKCLHVYHFLKETKRLDLININLLRHKRKPGRPKTIKPGNALKRDECI